jgi:HEAT repeat protein
MHDHSNNKDHGVWRRVVRPAVGVCGVGVLLLAGVWLKAGSQGFGSASAPRRMAAACAEQTAGDDAASIPVDLPVPVMITRLLDQNQPFATRRRYAQRLAGIKSPQALQALADGFQGEAGENRRGLGRLMGETRAPIFVTALMTLLESGDDADALVAIQALAAIGGAENSKLLARIMNDDGWPDALRTAAGLELLAAGHEADTVAVIAGLAEIGGDVMIDPLAKIMHNPDQSEALRQAAALGLGSMGLARAADMLVAALPEFPDPALQAQLLDRLGHAPFPQIENTWQQFLAAPETADELRSAAVEALAHSSPEAVPFLQQMARVDRDANVREMAAWALSAHGPDGASGPALAEMVGAEPEPDVRRRLYEAMLTQAQNPAETILPVIQEETDVAARVAGFNALGDAVRRNESSALTAVFNEQIVPELTGIALSAGTLNIRMRAVFALRRAETAAAHDALLAISSTQPQQIARAARNGLRTTVQE